jgi:hypothetical protein
MRTETSKKAAATKKPSAKTAPKKAEPKTAQANAPKAVELPTAAAVATVKRGKTSAAELLVAAYGDKVMVDTKAAIAARSAHYAAALAAFAANADTAIMTMYAIERKSDTVIIVALECNGGSVSNYFYALIGDKYMPKSKTTRDERLATVKKVCKKLSCESGATMKRWLAISVDRKSGDATPLSLDTLAATVAALTAEARK